MLDYIIIQSKVVSIRLGVSSQFLTLFRAETNLQVSKFATSFAENTNTCDDVQQIENVANVLSFPRIQLYKRTWMFHDETK